MNTQELITCIQQLRLAISELMNELAGKSATNWGIVNDALTTATKLVGPRKV